MNDNFTLHIRTFADRVRAMNQMRSSDLKLTAIEANNLLADITQLSATCVQLAKASADAGAQTVEIAVDGGGFK